MFSVMLVLKQDDIPSRPKRNTTKKEINETVESDLQFIVLKRRFTKGQPEDIATCNHGNETLRKRSVSSFHTGVSSFASTVASCRSNRTFRFDKNILKSSSIYFNGLKSLTKIKCDESFSQTPQSLMCTSVCVLVFYFVDLYI